MNRSSIAIAIGFAAALICGCQAQAPEINVSQVSKLEVSHPSGGFVTTNQSDIVALVAAMRKAKPDPTLYDTAKTVRITFFAGTNVLSSIPAGGPLFDFEGKQYYERSGEFRRVLSDMLNRGKKKQNQLLHRTQ